MSLMCVGYVAWLSVLYMCMINVTMRNFDEASDEYKKRTGFAKFNLLKVEN